MTHDLAVLTRNYDEHLAQHVGSSNAVTFYSQVRWRRASDALSAGKQLAVYFVAGGDGQHVRFAATLVEVDTAPDWNNAKTQAMLTQRADEAPVQAVLAGEAKTLFTVKNIVAITPPIPQTALVKESDETTIDPDYRRAYAVVFPHE